MDKIFGPLILGQSSVAFCLLKIPVSILWGTLKGLHACDSINNKILEAITRRFVGISGFFIGSIWFLVSFWWCWPIAGLVEGVVRTKNRLKLWWCKRKQR